MDPSPHLWFLQAKQRLSDPNSKSLCVPDITCSFVPPMQCDLAPELHVSMGPSPSQWFLHSKQRLLEQNYKSVWDPDLTSRFVIANLRD